MIDQVSIEELSRILVFAVPVAVLLTLGLLLWQSRRRKSLKRAEGILDIPPTKADPSLEADRKARVSMARYDAATSLSAMQPSAAGASSAPQIEPVARPSDPPAVQPLVAQPATPTPSAPVAAAGKRLDDLTARMATTDKLGLAALQLQIADAYRELGDDLARMTALRSAAGLASIHGVAADHARARLELADAAFAAGDLTGACEQWQMARAALLADGQKEAHARIEKRMRDTGCPTDWVLTDF